MKRPGDTSAVPCLNVTDARTAAAYYRDVLGFEQVALLGGEPPIFAIMRKQGATVLLQGFGARPARPAGPPWDAVLLVPDVQAAHNDLRARGLDPLGEVDGKGIGWDSFDFADRYGNVICVGDAAGDLFEYVEPQPEPRLSRLRARRQARRSVREEAEHRREFQGFYDGLANKDDIFYMFFTSDLLHWVVKAESCIPADVNLVLLGSALTAAEQQWIREHLRRPFHHIRLPIDDVSAWEFLFTTQRQHFGWVDIDCFVLNPELFKEMTALDPGVSMNCTWSWESGYDFRLANTHLLYINVDAIRAVADQQVSASPCVYDWTGAQRQFPQRRCYMKVPTKKQLELLATVLPVDATGRPPLLAGAAYYNTLVVYQLLALASGYPVHPIRDLARRCGVPVDAESTDPAHWPEDMSDELFHLFGVSYYKNYHFEVGIRALYLAAEYIMLENSAHLLPAQYADLKATMAAELAAAGQEPDAARERFRRHLITARELSEAAADRCLAPPDRVTAAGQGAPR